MRKKWFWVGMAVAALALASRDWGHLLRPELWAEDGTDWLYDGYTSGPVSLFWPAGGYLQTLSRLTAEVALWLGLWSAPSVFAWVAFGVRLLPVALLFSGRGAVLVPSVWARVALAAFYIGEPDADETYVNLTNAMWHLAVAAMLVVLLPAPKTRAGVAGDMALLGLSGLSGPLVLFMAPIAWWQAAGSGEFAKKARGAAVLSLCAGVQVFCVLTHAVQRDNGGGLEPSFSRLVHILANQVLLGAILGVRNMSRIFALPFWQGDVLPGLVCLLALAVAGLAWWVGKPAYRQFAVFAAAAMAAALVAPLVSRTAQWQTMQIPGAGARYYVIPMLAWFASVMVVAGWAARRHGKWVWLGLAPFLLAVLNDWHVPRLAPTGFAGDAARFAAAAAGTSMEFHLDPAPWHFVLVKR